MGETPAESRARSNTLVQSTDDHEPARVQSREYGLPGDRASMHEEIRLFNRYGQPYREYQRSGVNFYLPELPRLKHVLSHLALLNSYLSPEIGWCPGRFTPRSRTRSRYRILGQVI
jgi:hypothetical protein